MLRVLTVSQVTTTDDICLSHLTVEKCFLPVFQQLSACKLGVPILTRWNPNAQLVSLALVSIVCLRFVSRSWGEWPGGCPNRNVCNNNGL